MPADDSKAIDAAVQKIHNELGEIDIVVANAGICIHQNAEDMTDKEFEDVYRVNTFGPYYLARAAYRTWFPTPETPAKDKVILFVSSISGLITNTPQNQVSRRKGRSQSCSPC